MSNAGMLEIENETYRLEFDRETGASRSLVVKPLNEDILGEKRLAALFDLRLQLPDYECNYRVDNRPPRIRSIDAQGVEFEFDKIQTEKGAFPVSVRLGIRLDGDAIRFSSRVENRSHYPVAEFWFPRLGGFTRFGNRQDTEFFWPGYSSPHFTRQLTRFPTGMALGSILPEEVMTPAKPPFPTMPWFDLHNRALNKGLYFGYHDPLARIYASRFGFSPCVGRNIPGDNWPTPELLGSDDPIGLEYAFIRFPYVGEGLKAGPVFDAGEFVIQFHDGDWHDASAIYRSWWDRHFKPPAEPTWLRRRSCWFSGMCLQPEDRINGDYETYTQWAVEAKEFGIDTAEICAWDKGGQDRDYPEYDPDPRLGGEEGFKRMIRRLQEAGVEPVVFANYNAIDASSDLFRRELHRYMRMDEFGNCENWMSWGQSTIQARHALSARRQVWASASIPRFNDLIAGYFTRLAAWGVKALQIDKTGASEQLLDFNPFSTRPPDTAMAEGTVRSCEELLTRCREIQPDFCFASEASSDRYIPFLDVFYRGATGVSCPPMHFVFPEWTPGMHVSSPFDFDGVNAAVRFGCLLVVEPFNYRGSLKHPLYAKLAAYIREINRIRGELAEDLFLSRWLDGCGAWLEWNGQRIAGHAVGEGWGEAAIAMLSSELPKATGDVPLAYSVHENRVNGRRSLVVVNRSDESQRYRWHFLHADIREATLHAPFQKPLIVTSAEESEIAPGTLHVLVAGGKPGGTCTRTHRSSAFS